MRCRTVLGLSVGACLVVAAGAAAAQSPSRLDLPDGWQPEGIARGPGNVLYAGSSPSGAVVRIDARTGRRRIVVPGRRGHAAKGLKLAGRRLFVAGANTGRAWVYDVRDGRQLAAYTFARAGADTFINDVAVTRRAAYFTDSRRMALFAAPLDLSRPRMIALRGIPLRAGNNLNGIVATRGGRTLIAVQTNTGRLWRITPSTGRAAAIDLGGASVIDGDGLLLVGHRLYVVRNQDNRIVVVNLSGDLRRGRVVRSIRSRDFDDPTTIARIGRDLYAVNARFGTTPTPRTRYWITRVRL